MRLIDADEVLKKMDMLTENKDSMSDFYSGLDTGRELITNAIEERAGMKIEDCKTLPEFFGVEENCLIWINGEAFTVRSYGLLGSGSFDNDGRALLGCLTGQLEWTTEEPILAEEENILREIAAWHNNWETLDLTYNGTIYRTSSANNDHAVVPFGKKDGDSKAYTVLAPILQKYGEINLDEYREESK